MSWTGFCLGLPGRPKLTMTGQMPDMADGKVPDVVMNTVNGGLAASDWSNT